jgi:hypothetical protein
VGLVTGNQKVNPQVRVQVVVAEILLDRPDSPNCRMAAPTVHARRVLALFGRVYGPVGQAFQPDVVGETDAKASACRAGSAARRPGFLI